LWRFLGAESPIKAAKRVGSCWFDRGSSLVETHFFQHFFPLFWAILFQFYRGAQQASKQSKQAKQVSKASKLVSKLASKASKQSK